MKRLSDAEFKFYDEIYHPQTGGWTQTPLFHRALADYMAGTFDPKRYMELLDQEATSWLTHFAHADIAVLQDMFEKLEVIDDGKRNDPVNFQLDAADLI